MTYQRSLNAWLRVLGVYKNPRVIGMLFLGFSAGLPYLLVAGTLTGWLKDSGVDLATIGFLSWVGMAHSVKILLAPVVDRVPIPLLTRIMGRRRSWMIFSQLGLFISLFGMACSDPLEGLFVIAICAVFTGTASAVQDIAIDAYRIEAVGKELQGPMAASYVMGYRIAMLTAGAGAFHFAGLVDWAFSYTLMALFALVGIITTLIIREPDVNRKKASYSEDDAEKIPFIRKADQFFTKAFSEPILDFFRRYGNLSILLLVFIAIFRISDIFMGVMANPFYLDLGFTKTEIANITAIFGMIMVIVGAGFGGVLVARFGIGRMLISTAFMVPLTNLAFSLLAKIGPDIHFLVLTITADNITAGMATSVFIAYLSRLTNTAYTATQYALFSSLMTLPGQFFAGFTGGLAKAVGWVDFFIIASCIGIPTIFFAILVFFLANPDVPPSHHT